MIRRYTIQRNAGLEYLVPDNESLRESVKVFPAPEHWLNDDDDEPYDPLQGNRFGWPAVIVYTITVWLAIGCLVKWWMGW